MKTEAGFEPMSSPEGICPVSYYDAQRSTLIDDVIDFMRGEKRRNIQVWGPEGCGKTALVMNLAEDLPELRIVYLPGERCCELGDVVKDLEAQPLRFMLVLDDIGISTETERALKRCRDRGVGKNILLCSTAAERCFEEHFPVGIGMEYPKSAQFMGMVTELIESRGMEPDRAWVKNACIDHQVDARDKLTITAAARIAEDFAERRI